MTESYKKRPDWGGMYLIPALRELHMSPNEVWKRTCGAFILITLWGCDWGRGGAGVVSALSQNEKRAKHSELVKWIFNAKAEMIRMSPM